MNCLVKFSENVSMHCKSKCETYKENYFGFQGFSVHPILISSVESLKLVLLNQSTGFFLLLFSCYPW